MLGKRITALRKEAGLTQEQLAKRLNITRSALSQYELGSRNPDYDLLLKIADFFEVTVDYLLGKPKSVSVVKEEKASYNVDDPDLQIAFREASDFSEEAKQQAIDFIKYLKEKEKKRSKDKGKEF
ncbi:helix-turn-helix domain-containing protein [Bacillus sonorensis]|uniref:helix-turn-helix domain-containing protein n=1 Tax=Bacillus sonorensis TaxID=119858 RepID=UPI0022809E1B|nr:helix-turn-helix transcriptional regulator [Bacillus sonorensis]MCY8565246.1 helix-turn-helix transcriptional regulator [Bacillus sonorensis]